MTLSQRILATKRDLPHLGPCAIAKLLDCNRFYVADVLCEDRKRKRKQLYSSVPVRCPGCGGMVQMPCKACVLEASLQRF